MLQPGDCTVTQVVTLDLTKYADRSSSTAAAPSAGKPSAASSKMIGSSPAGKRSRVQMEEEDEDVEAVEE